MGEAMYRLGKGNNGASFCSDPRSTSRGSALRASRQGVNLAAASAEEAIGRLLHADADRLAARHATPPFPRAARSAWRWQLLARHELQVLP